MSPLYRTITALALASLGCVEQPGAGAVQCKVDSDCNDAAGEICDEGICWGDPPTSVSYAATLSPPEGRNDLPHTELASISISQDGTTTSFEFAETMNVSGRVLMACKSTNVPAGCGDDTSIAARLAFERPSRIPGQPKFKRSIEAAAGVGPDDDPAFNLTLPELEDGETYTVTVTALSTATSNEAVVDPSTKVAPSRFQIERTDELADLQIELGHPAETKEISGRIRDDLENGVAGMQVFARGRWTADGSLVRASNVVITDASGEFRLQVPIAMENKFDIIAQPTGDVVLPTLQRLEVTIPDPSEEIASEVQLTDLVLPSVPSSALYTLRVAGISPSGEELGLAGAQVTMTTTLSSAPSDPGTRVTHTFQAAADDQGTIELRLLPGASSEDPRNYTLDVIPAGEAVSATLLERKVAVGEPADVGPASLGKIVLPSRLPMSSSVTTNAREPVAGASIVATVSRPFRGSLGIEEQSVVDRLALPSALSNDDGGFVLWVDPTVASIPAVYDLDVVPPADSGLPRWSKDEIAVADADGALAINSITIPPAVWVRGVARADGSPIAGAEIRIFELEGSSCSEGGGDESCTARLRGIWLSDEEGWARVVLPDADRGIR